MPLTMAITVLDSPEWAPALFPPDRDEALRPIGQILGYRGKPEIHSGSLRNSRLVGLVLHRIPSGTSLNVTSDAEERRRCGNRSRF